MAKVLIFTRLQKYGEYDIFNQTNCEATRELIRLNNNSCYNVGNKLWFQGLMSAIDVVENEYDFLPYDFSLTESFVDNTNNTYDFIIAPMANIFNRDYSDLILRAANNFKGIKIPVYIIACGAQASSYEDLDDLVDSIGEASKRFLDSVYNTGGEFALRGEFTKSFFDRLGSNSAVVTGCPSLYQLGPDLSITKTDVSKKEFSVVLNGSTIHNKNIIRQTKAPFYVDQDNYYKYVNFGDKKKTISLMDRLKLIKNMGLGGGGATLLMSNRLKLFFDMSEWREWLIKESPNLSFGSRIHGNIMPILSGIPAVVYCEDSRTREMTEFFNIPHINSCEKPLSDIDLYEVYYNMNYEIFNNTFAEKFNAYEEFLRAHKIVKNVNRQNKFFRT